MKQTKNRRAGRGAARRMALPLLLGGLALLCLLGLAGCGGAFWTKGPKEPENPPTEISNLPEEGKPPATHPQGQDQPETLRTRRPGQIRWPKKTKAVVFAPGEACIDRALQLLAGRHDSFAQELGLFDLDEDGTPELMVITYGTWMRGFLLYELSGPVPVYLGWHWGPDPAGPAYARQTEYGPAWRLDGNYSHGRELLNGSELFIPTEKGLRVWWCGVDSTLLETAPYAPGFWRYQVEQSLFEEGRTAFSQRREETLIFPTDELLEARAAQDEKGRPPQEQLKENESPIAEMEQRLETSLYHALLSGDWAGVPPPWLTESDIYASNNFSSWAGIDLRTRLRRLYAAWEETHGKAV